MKMWVLLWFLAYFVWGFFVFDFHQIGVFFSQMQSDLKRKDGIYIFQKT